MKAPRWSEFLNPISQKWLGFFNYIGILGDCTYCITDKSQCGVCWYPEDLLMNEQNGVSSGNDELLRIIKLVFTYVSYINLHFIMLIFFFVILRMIHPLRVIIFKSIEDGKK